MALPAIARNCLPYPFYTSRAELAALARALRSSHDICVYLCVFGCVFMYLRVFAHMCVYLLVFARICTYLRVFASICPHLHVFCASLRLFARICAYLYIFARIVENHVKMLQKRVPKRPPKSTKNDPKSTPGGSQNGVWLLRVFGVNFGSFEQLSRGPKTDQKSR